MERLLFLCQMFLETYPTQKSGEHCPPLHYFKTTNYYLNSVAGMFLFTSTDFTVAAKVCPSCVDVTL